MKRHIRFLGTMLAVSLLLALAAPALAGGWAAVTLDALPGQVVAGQPVTIGFMVRQHGQRPMTGLTPKVIATRPDTGEKLTAYAEAQGEAGHYAATLTFPSAGRWNWTIDAYGAFPQPMPKLTELTPAPASASSARTMPASMPVMIGFMSLIAAVSALLLLARTRAAWAAALAFAAGLVCVASFASAANQTFARTVSDSPSAASQAEVGQALFLAKGCVICHRHDAVSDARKDFADFSIGPDLSNVARSPEYVRMWLKDPSVLKPDTQMPNLQLSSEEIEALLAFLKPGAGQ